MQARSTRDQDKTSTNTSISHATDGIHSAMDRLALDDEDVGEEVISDEEKQLHATLREDEFLALEAIYPPEHVRVESGDGSLSRVYFDLPISCSSSIDVEIVAASPEDATASTTLKLSHLPLISLHVTLPVSYPLKAPPRISHLSSPWLSSMPTSHQSVCRQWIATRLMDQWEEMKGEILWTWGEWLREGWVDEVVRGREKTPLTSPAARPKKAPSAIRLVDASNGDSRTHTQAHGLAAILTAYDRLASQSAFDKDRFMCGICLEAKRGDSCVRVDACNHVFCRECMVDYLTLHLTEGSLHLAQSCPDPSCTARGGRNGAGEQEPSVAEADQQDSASPTGFISDEQMAQIISNGEDKSGTDTHPLLARLQFLKKKAEAEADPTAVPCPRPDCQTLTGARDEDKGTGGRWESFRQCKECGMSFCVWCRKTWHAPSPCALPSTSSLIEKYDASDAKGKLIMERRYGRKNLLKLKAAYEEEKANQDWLKGKTQACPHCSCNVEKSFGCNHMTCGHCNTHFCYLCGTRINPAHPYLHFNTPGGKCFNRLFDGVLERGVEEGQEEEEGDEPDEDALQRRREEEQHQLALAAIQAAYGE